MSNNYENQAQNKKSEPKTYIDYEIFQGKIRLILDGQPPKIIDRDEAIDIAHGQKKNLVQVAYNKTDFPHSVCKIIDYNKFKYEQKQREKQAKKAAKAALADIKEIIFSIRIDEGDMQTKIGHIKQFLSDGKTKVKITVKLSKRELNRFDYAKDLMKTILDNFTNLAVLDGNISCLNGALSCVLRPIK